MKHRTVLRHLSRLTSRTLTWLQRHVHNSAVTSVAVKAVRMTGHEKEGAYCQIYLCMVVMDGGCSTSKVVWQNSLVGPGRHNLAAKPSASSHYSRLVLSWEQKRVTFSSSHAAPHLTPMQGSLRLLPSLICTLQCWLQQSLQKMCPHPMSVVSLRGTSQKQQPQATSSHEPATRTYSRCQFKHHYVPHHGRAR